MAYYTFSGDTVPTTQEICHTQEEFDVHEHQSWGAFYPIDSRFYPIGMGMLLEISFLLLLSMFIVEFQDNVYTFGRDEDCSYSFDIPSIRRTSYYKQYSKQHFTIKRVSRIIQCYIENCLLKVKSFPFPCKFECIKCGRITVPNVVCERLFWASCAHRLGALY